MRKVGRLRKLGAVGLLISLLALASGLLAPAAVFPQAALAVQDAWTPLGPSGGHVLGLALSPGFTRDRMALAVTTQGLFSSDDGAASWVAMNGGLPRTDLSAVALSPAHEQDLTLFAGTFTHSLYRSTDGGQSWHPSRNGILSHEIRAIAFSPDYQRDGTIFVTTAKSWVAGWGMAGVFRSTDRGETWEWCRGLPQNASHEVIGALAISPQYASDRTLYVGSYGYGVFRSSDGGDTWDTVNVGLSPKSVTALAISPDYESDQTVYVAIWDVGVFRTINAGLTWLPASQGLQEWARRIHALAVAGGGTAGHTLFLASERGVYKSSDGGGQWQPSGTERHTTQTVVISPGYATDHTALAGSLVGVLKTHDGGESWQAANAGLTAWEVDCMAVSPQLAQDGTAFVGRSKASNPAPIMRTDDGGLTWSALPMGDDANEMHMLAVSPFFPTDQALLAGTGQGLWKSSDAGDSWTRIGLPWQDNDRVVRAVGMHPSGDWFAVTATYVYASSDGGATWRWASLPRYGTVTCLAFSSTYDLDGKMFIGEGGTTTGGLLVSVNRGRSWSRSSTWAVESLAVAQDGTIFVGRAAGGGVGRSTDGGGTWQALDLGAAASVEAVAVSPDYARDRTVYAGTQESGVWQSTDGGQTWAALDGGPADPRIRSIFVRAGGEPDLLVGTWGSGVWSYQAVPPTPTPTVTSTHTPTATLTETPTATATPTSTPTEPAPVLRLYLPVIQRNVP